MQVEFLSERATLPRPFMGYHLFSAADEVVPAGGKALIATDLKITLPEGISERVVTCLAFQTRIDVGEGDVIRGDQGNVSFFLFNHGKTDFKICAGNIVAQLILERTR